MRDHRFSFLHRNILPAPQYLGRLERRPDLPREQHIRVQNVARSRHASSILVK
jgi:hypothetical protein